MASKKDHNNNIAKLKALGMTDADIQAYQSLDEPTFKGYGNTINNNEYEAIASRWNTKQVEIKAKEEALVARTPDILKNDPSFQALPADMKEIAIYNYEVQKANDQQKAQALAQSLEMATQQADPYWKSILLIAQDEVLRGFEEAQGDYQSSLQRQQRIMENIQEDLTTNKDFLTLEQQSDLANLKRNYEVNQEQIIEGAANQGLTFSTKRALAEKRLAEENQGLVESTNRQYNKQITDLQTAAGRDTEEAQAEIEDLQRRMGTYTTSLGRKAETYLGSSNIPELPGYQPLGNITGDMYEEKVKDIEARKQGIYGELTQASLQYE